MIVIHKYDAIFDYYDFEIIYNGQDQKEVDLFYQLTKDIHLDINDSTDYGEICISCGITELADIKTLMNRCKSWGILLLSEEECSEKDLFSVLNISKDDANRYYKVVEQMESAYPGFQNSFFEGKLFRDAKMDERIMQTKGLIAQLLEIKQGYYDEYDFLHRKPPFCRSYHAMEYYMDLMGVINFSTEDWIYIVKICLEKQINEAVYSNLQDYISFIGYINIYNPKLIEKLPEIEKYRQTYIKLRKQGKSIQYIKDRWTMLKRIKNSGNIPEDLLDKITTDYRKYVEDTDNKEPSIIRVCQNYEEELKEVLDYDIVSYAIKMYGIK